MQSVIDQSWYQKPNAIKESDDAGGIVVQIEHNKPLIALIKEANKFTNYVLPKGHVEPGETFEQAARREILEEAGFDELNLISEIGTKERLTFHKNEWIKVHYFLFTTSQVTRHPTDKDHDYDEVFWADLEHLPEFFWPEQKELIEENKEFIKKLV